MSDASNDLISLTADIVSAHVSNNNVAASEVAAIIQSVYSALATAGSPPAPAEPAPEPAVAIRASVKRDHIVCLEDGVKMTMLKRYLRTHYNMSPEEYRAKWKLPRDYPMVAPAYAEKRRGLAKQIGLGRKPMETPNPVKAGSKAAATKAAPAKRTRKPKAETASAPNEA